MAQYIMRDALHRAGLWLRPDKSALALATLTRFSDARTDAPHSIRLFSCGSFGSRVAATESTT